MIEEEVEFCYSLFYFFVMDWNLKAPSWDLVDHVDKATTYKQSRTQFQTNKRTKLSLIGGVIRLVGWLKKKKERSHVQSLLLIKN